MQKMPFSRAYSQVDKSRHSHVLDESLQFFDYDRVEQPIVKPLYKEKKQVALEKV